MCLIFCGYRCAYANRTFFFLTMSILVTGGAGYIGSFVVRELLSSSLTNNVVVLDDFSTGVLGGSQCYKSEWITNFCSSSIPSEKTCSLHVGNCMNENLLENIFLKSAPILGVMHLAAHSIVETSIHDPLLYYENNLRSMFSLLKVMRRHHCRQIVFSSSCTACLDTSSSSSHAYGDCKQWGEQLLSRSAASYGFSSFALRLFNVSGASTKNSALCLGELHDPETHLIPAFLRVSLAVKAAVDNGHSATSCGALASVWGNDYKTFDGTCIRDYIHVEDVAQAHVLSLGKLLAFSEKGSSISTKCSERKYLHFSGEGFHEHLEIGSGNATSIKQLINIIEDVTGYPLPVRWCHRRVGDVPKILMENPSLSRKKTLSLIGWTPSSRTVRQCVEDTWHFMLMHQKKNPAFFF